MEDIEFWRDIQGFTGLYQVSNLGRVKSLLFGKERILKPKKDQCGYLKVTLCKEGNKTYFFIHRLVYQTFVGEIPEGMQVNHIDEVKTNNRLENLNLMTPKENCNWGTKKERQAETQKNRKDISKEVIQVSLDGVELARFPSTMEIERQFGFNHSYISKCCNGNLKRAYSYIWRYA